jgi:hypothetical protein
MRNNPTNNDDIIDSRDIIKRIGELDSERENLRGADEQALEDWDTDNADELKALKALAAEGYPDWAYGETLIRESYWGAYVQGLVLGVGGPAYGLPSYIEIDWDRTADNIRAGYTALDYDGVTYLVRSC